MKSQIIYFKNAIIILTHKGSNMMISLKIKIMTGYLQLKNFIVDNTISKMMMNIKKMKTNLMKKLNKKKKEKILESLHLEGQILYLHNQF